MTVHYANVRVDIEQIDDTYRCRLFHCNDQIHFWVTNSRWWANVSSKRNIRRYKQGWRPKPLPDQNATYWTIR